MRVQHSADLRVTGKEVACHKAAGPLGIVGGPHRAREDMGASASCGPDTEAGAAGRQQVYQSEGRVGGQSWGRSRAGRCLLKRQTSRPLTCPTRPEAPLTVALPDHICLLLLAHTCHKHGRVTFVHRVCDLVREQVCCRGPVGGWGMERGGQRCTVAAATAAPVRSPPRGPDSPPGLLCT